MSKNDVWHDDDIVSALGAFQPQPSERFFKRMQKQPWMAQPMTTPTHVTPKRTSSRRWIPVMGMLATLFIVGTVFVTPPLRALAQDMWAWVVRVPSDTATVAELEAMRPPIEAYKFNITLAEAEQQVGFDAWELPTIPDGFQLQQVGAIPVERTIELIYATAPFPGDPNGGLPPSFVLSQQLVAYTANGALKFPVGASAVIETVQIGDVTGEYMEGGGWCGGNSDPETELRWCPSPNERVLHWQRGDWVFTLSAMDNTNDPYQQQFSITREQMIELATNLVPPQE